MYHTFLMLIRLAYSAVCLFLTYGCSFIIMAILTNTTIAMTGVKYLKLNNPNIAGS